MERKYLKEGRGKGGRKGEKERERRKENRKEGGRGKEIKRQKW